MARAACHNSPKSRVQRPKLPGPTGSGILAIIIKIVFVFLFLYALTLPAMPGEIHGSDDMEERGSLLPECPDNPNCVSSLSDDPRRKVESFPVIGSASESLYRLEEIIRSMPRTKIVLNNGSKLQAEFRTRLGFVDDVLFVADEGQGVIHVRSASRTGSWDLGVNRRRVERIRKRYEK